MEIKGFNGNDISEQGRDALQSQDWKKIREAMKAKVKHFTMDPLLDYGEEWGGVVREYLLTGYNEPDNGNEAEFKGSKYKILKRTGMTVFYNARGDTLFEVENERLAAEYECLMKECGEAREGQEDALEEAEGRGDEKEEKYSGVGGAVLKLQAELKNAENKLFAEPIIRYLIERCRESESLATDICQRHKTWAKCFDYIFAMARKQSEGNEALIREAIVFEWAEGYYHRDDKAEEEKKAKRKPAEHGRTPGKGFSEKEKPVKEVAVTNPDREKGTEKPRVHPNTKKRNRDMEGQIDIFSLMGM